MPSDTHRADERRFLDERGSNASLAPNGLNPATILEKAVRERIIESYFWKEQCFGVNEADIVDRVVAHVSFIGGTYGGEGTQRPSPFLCLAFKLLQLAPDDDVLRVYLNEGGERFKYLRALACFYVRLTRPAEKVYTILEPFLEDRRKLRRKGRAGTKLTFVDEFVDELLVKDRVCATSLWKMPTREILEDLDKLEPRVSPLGDIEDLLEDDEEEQEEDEEGDVEMDGGEEGEIQTDRRERSRSDSMDRDRRRRSSSEEGRMDVDRDRRSDRSDSRDGWRSRSRSRSRRRSRSRSRSDSR
ncbi:PRP38-domain-containing protein [Poronia punctata]|nr:PRP38-domain-containing protein [Poronia punctata]